MASSALRLMQRTTHDEWRIFSPAILWLHAVADSTGLST